ncbi:radical SAM protein [Candidatus Nomurabacteria bacterium]|nr:radical SAM protein [Candidatus Kaiserbacteria bacterium]MCB9814572.1 radical SAM protein [Candidatus Nomurabacteria bacterium]
MTYTTDLLEKGYFSEVSDPALVIVSIESACNLECLHCYWEHGLTKSPERDWSKQLNAIARWGSDLLFAGRILSPQGAKLIRDFYNLTGKKIGIIDNGYTILDPRYRDLLDIYDEVNVSIDGVAADHDRQRGKVGSSRDAWRAIHVLKEAGLDPIVSSCVSPINIDRWSEFEAELYQYDVPLSCTPVLGIGGNIGRMPVFSSKELIKAFEFLLAGVPKLINLLDPKHMQVLLPLLKEFEWQIEDDGYTAVVNSVLVKYRPYSLSTIRELNLQWDGEFYPFMDVLSGGKPVTKDRVLDTANSFARMEHSLVRTLFE